MIKFFEKENKLSWFITLVIAGLIFWISSLNLGEGTGGTGYLSLVYHFFAFFFLAGFLFISIVKGKKNYLLFLTGILLAVLYGILDEIHQYLVPGRYCSLFDVYVNSLGIFLASGIYFLRIRNKEKI